MNGHVDPIGRALVGISIRKWDAESFREIQAWIDTGFNGDLVLPRAQIQDLQLPPSGTVKAILADGSEVSLQRYRCLIDWFGAELDLEVVSREGEYPLLGVGLLLGHELQISYRSGAVTIQ
ncbi:MAG: clan AA aspartic protease [Planctomycetales bacterium]|nr:clan AA aspartic protease [Planctomycetales bacterium]NIO34474.1 clan AA aspartic protease [Planctomycetales bacterium]NIP69201.1 clan AA aspartic protease [Planctomycetales bacterium]